jgi:two-component system, OmpR family, sensor histidine kinase KdpD
MNGRLFAFSPGQYVKALITIIGTTVILYFLKNTLDAPIVALLYLLPVVFSTRLWGLGAGIIAAFCAFLAFNFFFILPYYTLVVHQTQDLLVLLVFLIIAVVISQLVARVQASLAEAQAREREATHLYELSTSLVGLRSLEAIAHTVVERVQQVFQAQGVEMTVQVEPDKPPLTIHLPAEGLSVENSPDHQIPLVTARGRLGTIRLWRPGQPLTSAEDRLLQTFASQGALALEYTLLAEAETRAKVLEESDRMKSALLSSVSHELRSPLVTIKAAASSLLDDETVWQSSVREELLKAVGMETDHLNRLVGNLLDMSRIEAGALQPQRQWNILAEIVNSVVARMRWAAEQHHLEINVSEELPLAPVDHVQIDQVFTNLLSNCLKYAPPDTPIGVSAWVEGEQLQIQVRNQGPPVPAEHLGRIFDKFYRATKSEQVTGTGLGLSICKGIIEAHGGHIWAENLPNGFAFNFTLPLVWDGMRPPHLPLEEV